MGRGVGENTGEAVGLPGIAVGAGVASCPLRRLPLLVAAATDSSSSSIVSGLPHDCKTARRRTRQPMERHIGTMAIDSVIFGQVLYRA